MLETSLFRIYINKTVKLIFSVFFFFTPKIISIFAEENK